MLEKCPYYEECSADTRQIRGNGEHYCLGTLNWEFCPEFKHFSDRGVKSQGYSKDGKIKRIVGEIKQDLREKLHSLIDIALITPQREILYSDYSWSESNTLLAQSITQYKMQSLNFGDSLTVSNEEKFLFLKVHPDIMLACMTKGDVGEVKSQLKDHISDYRSNLDKYVQEFPLINKTDFRVNLEENTASRLFEDLQKRLESINPQMLITDLNTIKDTISTVFAWNQIYYEISLLIERLKDYPIQTELEKQERTEILTKVREWYKTIRQMS